VVGRRMQGRRKKLIWGIPLDGFRGLER